MPEITCPHCGQRLEVPADLVGQQMLCGACECVIEPQAPTLARRATRIREDYDDEEPRPRRRFRDDEDDGEPLPRRRRKKKGSLLWLWLLLGFGGVALIAAVVGGIVFIGYKIANPSWKSFTPPDGRFTADFPGGNPKMQNQPIPRPNGPTIPMTIYLAETSFGREAYFVGYMDISPDEMPRSRGEIETILNSGLDGMKDKSPNGGTMKEIRRSNLTMSGQPAKELVADFTDPAACSGRAVVRIVLIDNRVYILMVLGIGNGVSPANTERFFSSFKPTVKMGK
jgi:hypothetical protein